MESKVSNVNLIINDTLKLSAYLDECGEFGGHREQIRIFKRQGSIPSGPLDILGADLYIDTVKCAPDNKKRLFVKIKTVVLTASNKKIILDYMRDLLERAFNEKRRSNSGRGYTVECAMPRIAISYVDEGQDWLGFYRMKKNIFQK